MKRSTVLLTALVGSVCALSAQAGVVWDYSPGLYGTTMSNAYNFDPGQYFADTVSFGNAVEVSGMAVYSAPSPIGIGDPVHINFWYDYGGGPGVLLTSFTSTISAIDSDGADTSTLRKYASFPTPVSLSPGRYWVGMTGTSEEKDLYQGFLALVPPDGEGNGYVGLFWGSSYEGQFHYGDMAFRLYSGAETVPEPAAMIVWLLLLPAGFAIGWWRRRQA